MFVIVIVIDSINNVKSIQISQHSFSTIDFPGMTDLKNQLENLGIYSSGNKPIQCLDFAFLNNLPNLKKLDLQNNGIECIVNFNAIQKHSNLKDLELQRNKIASLNFNAFQGTNIQNINLYSNQLRNVSDAYDEHDDTSQSCLDFNSFNNMPKLQSLLLGSNQIQCIINFESIQQHIQLRHLSLTKNRLLTSTLDLSKFDKLKPGMNSLNTVDFRDMNLKYTSMQSDSNSNNCLDLQFLIFMPNVEILQLSYNKIECIDNLAILRRNAHPDMDVRLAHLDLGHNSLLAFDFADIIGTHIEIIDLNNNNLSLESLKNFDTDTLLQINPSRNVTISIISGNDEGLKEHVRSLQSPQIRIV